MELYIAEKPKLALAIFLGLGGTKELAKKQVHSLKHYEIGNKKIVWCYGHMLESLQPHEYDAKFAEWNLDDLPFIFPYELKVRDDVKSKYQIIKKLVKISDSIVHCGDPDAAGQIIVDEILEFENYTGTVKRALFTSNENSAIVESLNDLKNNDDYILWGRSERARSRADYLFGLNFTRLFTLAAQKEFFNGHIVIGRVQSAILDLIDQRCTDVDNFKPIDFFDIYASVKSDFDNTKFDAKFIIEENTPVDNENHIINKEFTNKIKEECINKKGVVTKAVHKIKFKAAPAPFNLSAISSEMSKKFNLSAQDTLDELQCLYDEHVLITYPRSSCRFLSEKHFKGAGNIINNLGVILPEFSKTISHCDTKLKHKCFDDTKLQAHHGIIPTIDDTNKDLSKLTDIQLTLFKIIVRSYLALFLPESQYNSSALEIKIDKKNSFHVSSENLKIAGWQEIYRTQIDSEISLTPLQDENNLRRIKRGDEISVEKIEIKAKKTKPPKLFTESSLIEALPKAVNFVNNPELKKHLLNKFKDNPDEKGGIGTEATRAGIMDKVLASEFIIHNKTITTSEKGKLINKLIPAGIKKVDVTAVWASYEDAITKGKMEEETMIKEVYSFISSTVERIKKTGLNLNLDLVHCPLCKTGLLKQLTSKKDGKYFYVCTESCSKKTYSDLNGKPDLNKKPSTFKKKKKAAFTI